MKTNGCYKAAVVRIRRCSTLEELKSMEKTLRKIYNTGAFTDNEFMRLDQVLCDCVDKLSE